MNNLAPTFISKNYSISNLNYIENITPKVNQNYGFIFIIFEVIAFIIRIIIQIVLLVVKILIKIVTYIISIFPRIIKLTLTIAKPIFNLKYNKNYSNKINKKDTKGRTNLERMKNGLSPIDKKGNPIELHHIGQKMDSPLAEITYDDHKHNFKILHENFNHSEIDRNKFLSEKRAYWKTLANKYIEAKN